MALTRSESIELPSLLTPPWSPEKATLTDHELQSTDAKNILVCNLHPLLQDDLHEVESLDTESQDVHRPSQQLDSDTSPKIKLKVLQKLLENITTSVDHSLPSSVEGLLSTLRPIPATSPHDVVITEIDHQAFNVLDVYKQLDTQLPDTQRNSPEPSELINGRTSISSFRHLAEGISSNQSSDTKHPELTSDDDTSATLKVLDSSLTEYAGTQIFSGKTVTDDPDIQGDVVELSLQSVGLSVTKSPLNKISCRERKRIIVSAMRPPNLTKAMQQWINKSHSLLDPFRENDECWLHPAPPPPLLSIGGAFRPVGKLQKTFMWQDRQGKHSLVLNYGIVSKLVNYKMTNQQKDGFVNHQWHLSHLCGNWTCLNPAHTTIEAGPMNVSRNNCFSHRSGCIHTPPCLKKKKIMLGADGKIYDHTKVTAAQSSSIRQDFDDWSNQSFDDGEASMIIDGESSQESTLSPEIEETTAVES